MSDLSQQPKPIELCLERLGAADDRYVRCTAQVGRALGLALGIDGRILWCEQDGVGCEIWVSADRRLMAFCRAGATPTTLVRAGRVLELPAERPVVLRHGDELELAGTRFRLHVHGATDVVRAPTLVRTLARAAAAATLALAVGGAAGCGQLAKQNPDAGGGPADAGAGADAITLPAQDVAPIDGTDPRDAEIEVLESPPIVM